MSGVGGANTHSSIPSPRVPQLNVRGKNKKEVLGVFPRTIVKSADEAEAAFWIQTRASNPQQRLRLRVAVGGKPLVGPDLEEDYIPPLVVRGAMLLATWCKWVLSYSLRR